MTELEVNGLYYVFTNCRLLNNQAFQFTVMGEPFLTYLFLGFLSYDYAIDL